MTFSWSGRSVFVTGGTGLLGSWLIDKLIERGAIVTCLVRDRVAKSRLFAEGTAARINLVHGRVEEPDLMVRALNEYEVDTVFHLAAQTIVGTAHRSLQSTFESNIKGTWCVLEAARQLPGLVRRVVVASSDKAYGTHEKLPYTEEAPLLGRFPYDASKACSDLLTFSFAHTYGVPAVVTRCGNLYGGGDLNLSRIVPGTIWSALHGERPVIRSDGTLERDYFYVEDAAGAYLTLAEQLEAKKLGGEAFNFGTGQPLSVRDLVQRVLVAVGRTDLAPVVLGKNDGEIRAQWLDCRKAQRVLGWTSQFGVEDGLRRTVAWYRSALTGAGDPRP